MSEEERALWEDRWKDRVGLKLPPSVWLVDRADRLPKPRHPDLGRALDWAGGDGRHALWLAELGWQVTLADIAPTALAAARDRALERGLSLETVPLDLSRTSPPGGPWDLILCFHYLDRGIARRAHELLTPGGLLIWVHQTRRNLERHARPPEHFLLEEGELARLLPPLEVVHLEEGWGEEGRHEARAIARAPDHGRPA